MREKVRIEDWQKEMEQKFLETPARIRPKKGQHQQRSFEKRRAMAMACKRAWDDWIDRGFVVVTERGFKLCPEKM